MKKLLVVSDTFIPKFDGVTTFIKEIVPRLKNDFDVTLIVPRYDKVKHEIWEGIPTYKMRTSKIFKAAGYPAPIPSIFKMIKEIRKSDVVFVQSGPMLGGAAIILSRIFRKPVVMYMHQIGWEQMSHVMPGPRWVKSFAGWLVKLYARFISNRCNNIMLPSKEIKQIIRKAGIKSEVSFVPLGIDVDVFTPAEDKDEAKKAIGISHSMLVIGFCGRISYEKGLDTLIEAYKDLKEDNKNLSLLIVGEGEQEIKEKIRKMQDTKITGFVTNVTDHYHAMDIFVLPSLTETTGLTILEAMSCQLPVVVTPVGFALYLKNKYNAMIFPKRSVYVLKKRLQELIDNAEMREDIASAGRYTIEKKYTWTSTYRKIKKILWMV